MRANRRPLISKKKKKALFIEKSARILEDLFYEICQKVEIAQFVECGAHDAFASRKIMSKFPGINAIAFEANPHVFENFQQLVTSGNVNYINKAVSNRVGNQQLILKSKDTKSWSSEGYLELDNNSDSNLEKIEVSTTTLDAELANSLSKAATALWIDVEGSNKVLVEGAKGLLESKLVEVILIETQVDPVWKEDFSAEELCEELSLYGFEPIARDCPQHWGCNILFIKVSPSHEFIGERNRYLDQLEFIQLPILPNVQFRTILSKIKRLLISTQPAKFQEISHRIFSLLGSRSSRDKL
jgi:FkbM family methyltransferase